MQPPVLLTSLFLSLRLAGSAPIHHAAGVTARGNPGAIYLCTGTNWTGSCQYIDRNLINEVCTAIPSAFAHAQSIGGDYGPSCSVYSYAQPRMGATLDVTYPGTADAGAIVGWPGTLASFTCRFMYNPPK